MIKILIDSASDITANEAKDMGIEIIPMQIRFGTTEYLDGVDLYGKAFFEKLIESDELPQTTMINEERFKQKFAQLTADGSQLLVITISSKLSGTFDAACTAAEGFSGRVKVIDSLNASIGERLLCQLAIRLIKEGKLSLLQIVDTLNSEKQKIKVLAVLSTLEYLKRGGRISTATAIAGKILSIKPVIAVVGGELKLVGKAIGSKKSNNLLTQLVSESGGINFSMPYAVIYSGLSDDFLKKYIQDSESLWKDHTDNIPSYIIGSTVGTHIGPDGIGVAFFANKQ